MGKAFMTIRNCAFGRLSGRVYNDLGEGDSGIDAAALYANTCRRMTKRQFELVKLVCFPEPRPDGEYFWGGLQRALWNSTGSSGCC